MLILLARFDPGHCARSRRILPLAVRLVAARVHVQRKMLGRSPGRDETQGHPLIYKSIAFAAQPLAFAATSRHLQTITVLLYVSA
jgi:hypothetical protein